MSARSASLSRGYFVVTDVETAFLGLSGLAHDCLILLKHRQGNNPDAFPEQKWLADRLSKSVRTIQRALSELVTKGALFIRRTGRANRYKATYARCTVAELKALLEGDVPDPPGASDTTHPGGSDTPHSGGSIEEEPEKKNQEKTTTPSLREGGDAAAPHEPSQEESMRQHPQHDDEFDPIAALGGTQQDPLFPEPARTPRERSQAQQDAPYALAGELNRLLRGCPWAGPSPVNLGALAKNISTWKRDGLTADQIRTMMSLYVSEGTQRNEAKAPWIDFLSRRRALYQQAQRAQHHEEMEEHRYDEAYWLGDLADR